ncbi:MAG: phosphoribosyl-AMP cyclohydrolase [Deltaproteobacteria bacterium]|nr:phosphoribosyl-AMP cyclohydrolase [Candidatus Zymogenaceae bacterium]
MIELNFEKFHGLVPVVIQDHADGQVLMVGFMNREAWERTLAEGEVVYYSRSRDGMWKKGETSGNVQKVKNIFVDCDEDTLLITVDQVGGAACHTGYRTCFYRRVVDGEMVEEGTRVFDPDEVYKKS